MARGVIVRAGPDAVFVCPPLIITPAQIDEMMDAWRRARRSAMRLPSSAGCWAARSRRRGRASLTLLQAGHADRVLLGRLARLAAACLAAPLPALACARRLVRGMSCRQGAARGGADLAARLAGPHEPRLAGASARRGLGRAFHLSRGWRRIQHRHADRFRKLEHARRRNRQRRRIQHQRHLPRPHVRRARRAAARDLPAPYRANRDPPAQARAGPRSRYRRNSEFSASAKSPPCSEAGCNCHCCGSVGVAGRSGVAGTTWTMR